MTTLNCYYCAQGDVIDSPLTSPRASVTIHDGRLCMHVCWAHAIWRSTTSMVVGHSKDCPFFDKTAAAAQTLLAKSEAEAFQRSVAAGEHPCARPGCGHPRSVHAPTSDPSGPTSCCVLVGNVLDCPCTSYVPYVAPARLDPQGTATGKTQLRGLIPQGGDDTRSVVATSGVLHVDLETQTRTPLHDPPGDRS